MLSDAQIAAAREIAERTLPDTCTIQRKTTQNVGGEQVETWSDLATNVACRLAPVGGGEEGEVGGRISEEATVLITLPAKQDVEEADRIVLDGTTYEVNLVRKRGEWEITRRVECKEAV